MSDVVAGGFDCATLPLRVAPTVDLQDVGECVSCAAALSVSALDAAPQPTMRSGVVVLPLASGKTRLALPAYGKETYAVEAQLRLPAVHALPTAQGALADLVLYFRDVKAAPGAPGAAAVTFDAVVVLPVVNVSRAGGGGVARGVRFFSRVAWALRTGGTGGSLNETLADVLGGDGRQEALNFTGPLLDFSVGRQKLRGSGPTGPLCMPESPVQYYVLTQPVYMTARDADELSSWVGNKAAPVPDTPSRDVISLKQWTSRTWVSTGGAAAATATATRRADVALTRALQCVRIDPDVDVAGDFVRRRPGGAGSRTLAEELAEGAVNMDGVELDGSGGQPAARSQPSGMSPGDVESGLAIFLALLIVALVSSFLVRVVLGLVVGRERYAQVMELVYARARGLFGRS